MPIPDLFAALDLAPAEALACLATAAHAAAQGAHPMLPDSRVRIQLHNPAASRLAFRAIKSNTVGA